MNAEWKCKEVATTFMLGISRRMREENGVHIMDMNMEAYVEGMHNAFQEHIPTGTANTPCEPNLLLSLENESTVEEHKRVLARGYQSAVGMCLWAARCIKPECLYTMGQLCKVMSKPTEEAWKAVMHLIAYMYQHRHEGITFSSNGNHIPFFMTDASNKVVFKCLHNALWRCLCLNPGFE